VEVQEEEAGAMPENTKLKKARRKEEKMMIVMMSLSHLILVCGFTLLFWGSA
jgi:predicted nucleic acid-binding Zn ribbon protein